MEKKYFDNTNELTELIKDDKNFELILEKYQNYFLFVLWDKDPYDGDKKLYGVYISQDSFRKDEEYLDKDCLEEWGENTPLRGGGSGYEIAVNDFLKDRELIDYIREYGIK
jgi:hypothetical protein